MDALSGRRAPRRWHRRLAWVALLASCTFAITGLLHPLMTRMQPKPAQSSPPALPVLEPALPAPALALQEAGFAVLSDLRLSSDGAQPLWRARAIDGSVRYFDARRGTVLPLPAEQAHAERLARWYAGEPDAAIETAEQLHAFDADYSYVNRLLPVWRIRFARADGLTAYVSTEEDRLTTLSDSRKRRFQQWFQSVHSWSWVPAPWRNGWITALLAGVVLTVLLGLTLALRTPGRTRQPGRRLHRWGGVAVSIFVLAWAISGFTQTLGNAERERADAPQRPLRLATQTLSAPVIAPDAKVMGLRLVSVEGEPVWRWSLRAPEPTTGRGLVLGEHQAHAQTPKRASGASTARYVSAADGRTLADGEPRHLAELLRHFGIRAAVDTAVPVTAFNAEYGFLFKRLPVWRVALGDTASTAFFLDTSSERLAARVTERDRRLGALFAYAHKWEWLTPLAGKDVRDVMTTVFAALLLAVAIAGTLLRRASP